MTESEMYQKFLKPMFKENNMFCERIESPRVPDIYVYRGGQSAWVEMKCVKGNPKIVRPDWRPGQLAWIKRHNLYGGETIFLALHICDRVIFLKPEKEYEGELICQKEIFLKMFKKN